MNSPPPPTPTTVPRPVDLVCRNARKSPKFYKDPLGLRALYEKERGGGRERERERERGREREREGGSLGPCTNLHLENIMKQREATISRSEMTDGFGPPQVLPPPHARGPRLRTTPANETKRRGRDGREAAGRGETTGSLMTEAQWFSLRSSPVKRMRITRNLSVFLSFFLFFANYAGQAGDRVISWRDNPAEIRDLRAASATKLPAESPSASASK